MHSQAGVGGGVGRGCLALVSSPEFRSADLQGGVKAGLR